MTTDTKEGLLEIFNGNVEKTVKTVRFNSVDLADSSVNNVLEMASRLYKLGFEPETSSGLSRIFDAACTRAKADDIIVSTHAEEIAFKVAEKMHLKA